MVLYINVLSLYECIGIVILLRFLIFFIKFVIVLN